MTHTTIEIDSSALESASLEELWMPFTANRAFKRAPRMLVAAKDMHYTTADGRQILDGTAGLWCVNAGHCREQITAAVDSVIEDIRTRPVSAEELERARTKIRSSLYNLADPSTRFGLIDLLAVGAMWENDPRWANRLESGFSKVTPQLIQSTAREYLRPTNRSILLVEPAPAAAPAPATGAKQ